MRTGHSARMQGLWSSTVGLGTWWHFLAASSLYFPAVSCIMEITDIHVGHKCDHMTFSDSFRETFVNYNSMLKLTVAGSEFIPVF